MDSQQSQDTEAQGPQERGEEGVQSGKVISERRGPIANPKSCIRKGCKKMFHSRENEICKQWESGLNFQEFKWEPSETVSF